MQIALFYDIVMIDFYIAIWNGCPSHWSMIGCALKLSAPWIRTRQDHLLSRRFRMKPAMHPEHPDITEKMWTQIDEIIQTNRPIAGSIITALRECQNVVGYLPVELLDYISTGLNLPPSDVYGVASFYALFSMQPKGRHTIKLCLGTACYVKGIKEVMNRIENQYNVKAGGTTEDRRFTLEGVRCLGACGLAPVMVIGSDTHGDISSDKIINILENYK
jgi:NADH:ubiquinone oxidoreductase subunit E